ncbi:restriction endonuclease subunit S [Vreelandella sp. EE7]
MTDSTFPNEWHCTTLGSIAVWGSGGTPSRKNTDYYGGDIPWIKTGDLGLKVLSEASEYITDLGVQKSSAKFFSQGSVVIAMYGATIGKVSILGIDATTNQACGVGQPVSSLTDSNFLYYLLRNEKDAFIAKGQGGAQPNISQTVIKEHSITLPPLAEQKVIADKLDTLLAQVDGTKARLERIPEILKRFRQSVLAAAVSGRLTEEWRKKANVDQGKEIKLDEVVDSSFYGPRFSKNDYTNSESGIPTIRTTDMDNGVVRVTPETPKVEVTSEKLNQFKLQLGDLLITRTGSIGVMALFDGDYTAIPSAYLIRFRLKSSANKRFIYYALTSPEGQRKMGLSSTAITQPNINAKSIRALNFVLPSFDEQTEIVRRVDQLFAYADTVERQANSALERVNQLTQSILAKAFRGELTAQWREDNPDLISGENSAEALLARIKAERAAQAPKKRPRKKATT